MRSDRQIMTCILTDVAQVVMITGDNPLTACHVSRELHFTKKPSTLILTENDDGWDWENIDKTTLFPLNASNIEPRKAIWLDHALCVTGEVCNKFL